MHEHLHMTVPIVYGAYSALAIAWAIVLAVEWWNE
jgi:hypothetical protein